MSEAAKPIPENVRKEMDRISTLFMPANGDAEDLISYAWEIVQLRDALEAQEAKIKALEFDLATRDVNDRHTGEGLDKMQEIVKGLQQKLTKRQR